MGLQSEFAKSHWNYRVVRQTVDGETQYGVHEVYYRDSGVGWTVDPVAPVADSVEELRDVLRKMAVAPEFDVIDDPDTPAAPERPEPERLESDADRIVLHLCNEYGIEPGELTEFVQRDHSIVQAFDSLVAERERDLRAAGDGLAEALVQYQATDPSPWAAQKLDEWRVARGFGQGPAQPDQQDGESR